MSEEQNNFTKVLNHHKAVISLVEDIIEWHNIAMAGKPYEEVIALYDKLYQDEVDELEAEPVYADAWLKEYADCMFVNLYRAYLTDIHYVHCYDIAELIEEEVTYLWLKKVTENNWEKFPTYQSYIDKQSYIGGAKGLLLTTHYLDAEAKAIEAKYEGRYSGVTWSTVGTEKHGEVVIFRDHTGKCLKPLAFKELNYK